jgi:AGCS family alanine or glycine:cation symporter
VLWLLVAAVFFTVYLRGVNFRLFGHAFDIVRGKFDKPEEKGEVSNLQALLAALAGTVGLGSIAGVSVAVAVGGPGVIFWIVVAGLFGMASKFAEVCLSLTYRKIDENGKVFGGPFQFIETGMKDIGMQNAGKFLAIVFAIFCLGGALGGGNMFQSNQAVKVLVNTFEPLKDFGTWISVLIATIVFVVIIGSIKRIAKAADIVTPLKGILYLVCAIIVVAANIENLPSTLTLILSEAFTGNAATGGFIAMIALSFKRAMFANEAGLGSAPITHATARTTEPVRQATVALLEPFFAAMIGLLTGLTVVISGAYIGADPSDGVLIASKAYASVSPWFAVMLAVNVVVFAYSTIIAWSYYGEMAWTYLFGKNVSGIRLYQCIFAGATFLGGILHFGVVLDLSDLFILGMSLPNLIVVYLLRKRIKEEMDKYIAKYLKK